MSTFKNDTAAPINVAGKTVAPGATFTVDAEQANELGKSVGFALLLGSKKISEVAEEKPAKK